MPRPDIWLCNIKQLPYQPVVKVQIAENIPRGLKPVISYQAFAARLKSCPFKTRLSPRAANQEAEKLEFNPDSTCIELEICKFLTEPRVMSYNSERSAFNSGRRYPMQELNQPDASPDGRRAEADVTPPANPEPSTPNCVALNDLVYDLRLGSDNSDGFYRDVAQFSDRVVIETDRRMGSWLDGYASYVRVELREADRSRGEDDLDLLILGLALGQ